jgi:hypothetical protein
VAAVGDMIGLFKGAKSLNVTQEVKSDPRFLEVDD